MTQLDALRRTFRCLGWGLLPALLAFGCGGDEPGGAACGEGCVCSAEVLCDAGFECVDGACAPSSASGGTTGSGGTSGGGTGATGGTTPSGGTGGSGGSDGLSCVGTPSGTCDDDICDKFFGCTVTEESACTGEAGTCADRDNSYANCSATYGCELAPNGVCVEDEWFTCYDIESESTCNATNNCEWWDGGCEGTLLTQCYANTTLAQCNADPGCEWEPYALVPCEGKATACASMDTRDCARQDGCAVEPGTCSGTPTPCEELNAEQCLDQPGCSLMGPNGSTTRENDPTGPALSRADLATRTFEAYRGQNGANVDLYLDFWLVNRGAIAASNFTVVFVLSTDAVIGNDDDQVFFDSDFTQPVDVHASDAWGIDGFLSMADLQADFENGFYYIAAIIDEGEVITEYDEDNNVVVTPLPVFIGPSSFDLLASSATHDASGTMAPEDDIEVTVTIENLSTETIPSIPVAVYLSSDGVIDGSDVELCTEIVDIDAAPTTEATVSFTCALPRLRGTYQLLVEVDPDDTLVDEDRSNNVAEAAAAVVVDAPEPDLVITALSATSSSVLWSASATFNATVQNTGVDPSGSFQVSYYLDSELVCSETVASLAASASSAISEGCTLPTELLPGAYELSARADRLDAVFETNEGNNTLVAGPAFNITQPNFNFQVVNVGIPVGAVRSPGESLQFGVRVDNTGSVTLPASTISAFLSLDTNITTSDIPLCSLALAAMPAGQNDLVLQCSVPAETAANDYYVGVIVDPDAEIPELFENDNRNYDDENQLTIEN